MSSTNKTTNYNLSQFIGSDKPSWLNDINQDMTKIDTAIKAAADSATAAGGAADAANTSIGNLENLTTTAKTSVVAAINEVNTTADGAQTTANTASANVSTLDGKVTALVNKFNMNTTLHYTPTDVTVSGGSASAGDIWVARNADGSLYKVYGRMLVNITTSTVTVTLPNTGITVDEEYNIAIAGQAWVPGSSTLAGTNMNAITLKIKNNSIQVIFNVLELNKNHLAQLYPCLYFNTNFGDFPPIS